MEFFDLDTPTILIIGIVILSVLLLGTIIVAVIYSGLLYNIQVRTGTPPIKNFKGVYKFGRGPYSDSGAIFSDVVSISPKSKTFGVYYDDPKAVESKDLRWAVGCVTAEGKDSPDDDLVKSFTDKGFKEISFPAVANVVKTEFPYRSPLSIFIGVFRVYPQLSAFVKERSLCAHPMIEIYSNDTIHYMSPLCMQDDFYVPEASSEFSEILNHSSDEDTNSAVDSVCSDAPSEGAQSELISNSTEDGLAEGLKQRVRAKSEKPKVDPSIVAARHAAMKENTPNI
ncbi:hypothetical protein CAPTEDRAFT_179110 [Capitella teleta]|uniref:Testis-expressed sequence 264 protein n=1 Tax=Capitella teleta TaxID=283909 RepID=R7UT60_CAPTE|nr:hypothetical protein CAPTEDRAFT_179110 [Capitella teleta]|eukprot:ELU09699.1 hypothetical protein CAPTEDRAFT_179110 [Capitella teleta]